MTMRTMKILAACSVAMAASACTSLAPEVLCSPLTGDGVIVQSVNVVTVKQPVKLKRECSAFVEQSKAEAAK